METTTASSRMQALLVLYNMQTTFFKKAIDGISDEDAHNRLNTKANHIAWLAGTLVEQRFHIARDFGSDLKQSGDELFKNNQGIKDNVMYPSLAQYKTDWETISPISREAFIKVTDEKLDSIIDMGGMKMSFYDLIAFTVYREANCIGQIALWRRLLGYDAMKYG
jgi:hypothetical protein